MDLNQLLLWIVGISCALGLARIARERNAAGFGWLPALSGVLALEGLALLLAPRQAGVIAGVAWALLVLAPLWGLGLVNHYLSSGRYAAALRVATVLQWLHPTPDYRAQTGAIRTIQRAAHGDTAAAEAVFARYPWLVRRPAGAVPRQAGRYGFSVAGAFSRRAALTWALVAGNATYFVVEMLWGRPQSILMGTPGSLYTLSDLGALVPARFTPAADWWRLIAAMFLHGSLLHLLSNMAGLLFLGPAVERSLGRLRYLLVYFAAGIGGGLLIIAFSHPRPFETQYYVGASGAIMGLLGAQAAVLLHGLRRGRAAAAGEQLGWLVMLLLFQFAFDAVTPQVSMAAHLWGAAIGFVTAWLLGYGLRPEPGPERPAELSAHE